MRTARLRPALLAACLAGPTAAIAADANDILGSAPTYATRSIGTIPEGPMPNAPAMIRRIWSPGLDAGYVPQGLTVEGSHIYLGTYRSTEPSVGRGPCRIYRIDPATGATTTALDLPPSCGHAGGLAKGAAGRIWVVDTQTMLEIDVAAGSAASVGRLVREVRIEPPLRGSFAAGHGGAIWLGSYERDKPGRFWRIPLAAIDGAAIGERHASASFELPSRAQGAAFDARGGLWLTRSGATLGELLRLDLATATIGARYRMPDGIEDMSFDANGMIWTVSEAGSRRWSGWATHFPVVFGLDPAKLR